MMRQKKFKTARNAADEARRRAEFERRNEELH
jgi:hypothetical protein